MKIMLSAALSIAFTAVVATSAFAQCSHSYESADLSSLNIASEEAKPNIAMSTHDPVKIKDLLEDVKSTVGTEKIAD